MSKSKSSNSRRSAALMFSKELLELCLSDSISEEGLREIIERHRQNHDVVDYEFFLLACINKRVNEGIIQCLLEYFPAAASATDDYGQLPIHYACNNKNVTPEIIQLLIDAAPACVCSEASLGGMPLHRLCANNTVDEITAIEILELLIDKCPEAVRHADDFGTLPVHAAAVTSKSTEFCRMLIESYPGSERIALNGMLPLHWACATNTLAAVEYLYKLYPDAINQTTTYGFYPIHCAIAGSFRRTNPAVAADIVKFLLDCDVNVKLQMVDGLSLLSFACKREYSDSNIEAGIKVIKVIYDAHPEAIEDDEMVADIYTFHEQLQAFLYRQLVYSRQAKDHRLMTTPDENGQLPLHTALRNNVRLGSIKLLVKGNPPALQSPDNSGLIPLHVACVHHESANVVQYLIGLDIASLDAVDRDGNTALHIACRGARYEIVALLLDKHGAVSVSKRNACDKLPIDLLWESNVVSDRDSIEYTESVFRLVKAYPETLI